MMDLLASDLDPRQETAPMSRQKPTILGAAQLAAALEKLPDWRERLDAFHTAYVAPSAASALAFIAAIGQAAETLDHHPDLDWRYDHVFLRTTTHEVGSALTERDVALATEISAIAAASGVRAEPALSRTIEIGIDSPAKELVEETWLTALDYRRGRAGDLIDRWARGPTLWFQETAEPDSSRMHLDVHVVSETAHQVLDDVEAAGGTRLDSRFAPSWWVIGDADGNRLCVCTPDGRAGE
jgi:4a-hydroxytetrahydrobiopterin dehydratase